MTYDSGQVLCRRCLENDISENALREYLDGFAASLPENLRAKESIYLNRLALCEPCSHRIGYTCTLCGCYVQARAAKKYMRCPLPGSPRWEAVKEETDEQACGQPQT